MRYRSRLDIIYSMLDTCRDEPVNKTKLMYNAFISYSQLKSILVELLEAGVLKSIKRTDKEPSYLTTEKGVDFIRLYAQIHNILKMKIEIAQKPLVK